MKNFTLKPTILSSILGLFVSTITFSQCGITTVNLFPYNESFETGIGDWEDSTADDINWSRRVGATPSINTGPLGSSDGSYYMYIEASGNNNRLAIFESPCFNLITATFAEFTFDYHMFGHISGTNRMGDLYLQVSTDNGATYPTTVWLQRGGVQYASDHDWLKGVVDLTAYTGQIIKLRFYGEVGTDYPSDMSIDNINLSTTPPAALTEGPGGVTSDLAMWLKGTDGLSYTDGQDVSQWLDQGRGSNATVNTVGQEPTYYDNITENVNFNPVVSFDNVPNAASNSNYATLGQEYLQGTNGFYTQEMFIVSFPDETVDNTYGAMDMFCGNLNTTPSGSEDVSGVGWGMFSSRFNDEVLSYANGPVESATEEGGYGVAQTSTAVSYTNGGIINARNNASANGQELYFNDQNIGNTEIAPLKFKNINNSTFLIGRSKTYTASYKGKIAEIITFSSTKSDSDLTDERNRIQSYLAIKYGITLGTNGTSQDYVDSNGDVIWDQSANTGYNYDIAGIGRDDDSGLNQKQSSSVNNATDGTGPIEGILSMGLTDIYATNNLNKSTNANTLSDKDFLVWGSNNASLGAAPNVIAVDMSAGIAGLSTPVSFLGMQRIWKVIENGSDIGKVKISLPQNAIRNIMPPGNYYMFISDTGVFDPTGDYRVMNVNGTNLETEYDFDGTKFITFGYAPQVIEERSVYFDGSADYIDMEDALDLNPTGFTVSAWIKRNSRDVSILSKRNASYTEGYDLKILNNRRLRMSWGISGTNFIDSSTQIPENEWHQVAVIYNGTSASIYIDGVLDTTKNLSAPTPTTQSFFIAAAGKDGPTDHYEGNIDEVRVWNTALTATQLRYVMNQEIQDNSGFASGTICTSGITKDDISTIAWSDLAGYYPMSIYTYTNTDDASGNSNQGALRNLNTVDFQTAPLPYESTADGDWDTNATWLNGSFQTIPGAASIVDPTQTVNWNIVETSHDLTIDNSGLPVASNENRSLLYLDVKANEITLPGDTATNAGNALTVTHYLKIDGKIDLDGESQLIQTLNSDLDPASAGTLERDQQGTQDLYTYNYWSSPVGATNTTTNNNSYTVPQIFNDGTNPSLPLAINFMTSGYDGTPSAPFTPIGIADYWIWKYANLAQDYYNWQHVRSTGSLLAGEGFTLKGVSDTSGNVLLEQNYLLEGKPNNGVINLTIDNGFSYLVGNPYASALDADLFIADNPDTNGALYFWEHFGGGTHITSGYQGGYAIYNSSGGNPAMQFDYNTGTADPMGATGTKTPGRYVPVAQGFFVVGTSSGTINFNNGQRFFTKEGGASSIFLKSSNTSSLKSVVDDRLKIRLSFSSNAYKRQLLVTQDSRATSQIDFGFDAENTEDQLNDMFWLIDDKKFIIQGTDNIDNATILPLGIKSNKSGVSTFKIEKLENVPSDLEIYIYDKATDIYHDIKNNTDFTIDLPSGDYLDRFEMRFNSGNLLSNEDLKIDDSGIAFYFANNNETIIINNSELKVIKSVSLYDMSGKNIITFNSIENEEYIELKTKNINNGNYILEIDTNEGEISKKVLIE